MKIHRPHWGRLPGVRGGSELTLGERAVDLMKQGMATWTALGLCLAAIAGWIWTAGLGHDRPPYILLNLMLSCFAALQCFILLISAKRGDRIAYEVAKATLDAVKRLENRGLHCQTCSCIIETSPE